MTTLKEIKLVDGVKYMLKEPAQTPDANLWLDMYSVLQETQPELMFDLLSMLNEFLVDKDNPDSYYQYTFER